MVRFPTVDNGSWQPPVPPASIASQLSTPSVTVTVPRGTTPTAVTWTVTVTAPPATDGSGESLVMTVLVGTVLTTITSDVTPLKPAAVNTRRRGPSAAAIARSVYATVPFTSLPSWRVPSSSPPPPVSWAVTMTPALGVPAPSRT